MRNRPWLRPIAVTLMIIAWLAVSGSGGQAFGELSSVQENDAAAFLPESAESTQAAQAFAEFVPQDSVPGLFVITGLESEGDLPQVQQFVDDVVAAPLEGDPEGRSVGDVLDGEPAIVPSEDGQAALVVFSVPSDVYEEAVGEDTVGVLVAHAITDAWDQQETELTGYLTGALGFIADLFAAFAGIDGLLLLVALTVVFVILLIVYRSPVLPVLVLLTAMIALSAAVAVVYALAVADVITLNGQTQGIMFILVVGATTDYSLLIVARYREELLRVESPYSALWRAWRRSLEPIAASAGTVIAGLLVLLLSDLGSLQALGPAGAMGIVASALAALTLLPALLLIGGKRARGVFWPARPRFQGADALDESLEGVEARAGLWGKVSRGVGRRPRTVWIAATALLVAGAAFLPMLNLGGVGERDYFLQDVDSVRGFDAIEEHFAAGATSPVRVIVPVDEAEAALSAVQGVDGIDSAYVLTPSVAEGAPPGAAGDDPIVVNDTVVIEAVTVAASSSAEAADVVADVREAVHAVAPDALVGGQAAEALDTRLTTLSDAALIIPVVLAVIFVVLVLLLRALVAPALIVLANILSFGAALGISALVFNEVFNFPGVDPGTPLLAFVFLVALGVDYSIFLMSRAREESLAHGTRKGVRRALAVTGGVITSAGIVLAATFAALGVIPLLFLAQIAFIVAVGVLIDTFIVRSLLVPGLVIDTGRASWAPWHRNIDS